MVFKIVVALVFLATVNAYNPHGYLENYAHHYDHHAPAHYKFNYGVADLHTGDVKSQQETRVGDVVKGSYSLNEADGTKRIVHYTADGHNGFNAHVERVGHAAHSVHSVGLAGRGYWGQQYGGYGLGYGSGYGHSWGYGNGYGNGYGLGYGYGHGLDYHGHGYGYAGPYSYASQVSHPYHH